MSHNKRPPMYFLNAGFAMKPLLEKTRVVFIKGAQLSLYKYLMVNFSLKKFIKNCLNCFFKKIV
jgi:hypothetical protein